MEAGGAASKASCDECPLWGVVILINEIEQEVTAKVAFLLVS
jgi:hypothetical protein